MPKKQKFNVRKSKKSGPPPGAIYPGMNYPGKPTPKPKRPRKKR